jgi:hypothetical protein
VKLTRIIIIIITLLAPAAAKASLYDARLELFAAELEVNLQADLYAQASLINQADNYQWRTMVLGEVGPVNAPGKERMVHVSLPHEDAADHTRRISSNRSRVTMLSYLCGELITGVDVVAEVKSLRKSFRVKKAARSTGRKNTVRTRSGWKLQLGYMPSDELEVLTFVDGSGSFLDRSWTFGVNTVSDDVGVKTAYHDGELDVRVGNVKLGQELSAKIVMKF